MLVVQQCRWVRFGKEKGEIDVLLPQIAVAIECKVGVGELGRTNWEEATGQAIRDKQLLYCRHAYIAVPIQSVTPWLLHTATSANIGVISVSPLQATYKAVRFVSHPKNVGDDE
jgi:hypothetical protein